jgi:hypothetical protein
MKAKKKKESKDSFSLGGLWLLHGTQKSVVIRGQNGCEVVMVAHWLSFLSLRLGGLLGGVELLALVAMAPVCCRRSL